MGICRGRSVSGSDSPNRRSTRCDGGTSDGAMYKFIDLDVFASFFDIQNSSISQKTENIEIL